MLRCIRLVLPIACPQSSLFREVLIGTPSKGGDVPSSCMLYILRGLYPPDGGAVLLALPVGVETLEEGQPAFYQSPWIKRQPSVAILYPYRTVPSGETHWGSQDRRKRGIWGQVTRVAHGIPILTELPTFRSMLCTNKVSGGTLCTPLGGAGGGCTPWALCPSGSAGVPKTQYPIS